MMNDCDCLSMIVFLSAVTADTPLMLLLSLLPQYRLRQTATRTQWNLTGGNLIEAQPRMRTTMSEEKASIILHV